MTTAIESLNQLIDKGEKTYETINDNVRKLILGDWEFTIKVHKRMGMAGIEFQALDRKPDTWEIGLVAEVTTLMINHALAESKVASFDDFKKLSDAEKERYCDIAESTLLKAAAADPHNNLLMNHIIMVASPMCERFVEISDEYLSVNKMEGTELWKQYQEANPNPLE